jgi:hypothetical protein
MRGKLILPVLLILFMSGCYSEFRCNSETASLFIKYRSINFEQLPSEWEVINKYCPVNEQDKLLALYFL